MISSKQIRTIKTIVNTLQLTRHDTDKEMVMLFTGGRTERVSEMMDYEANGLIERLFWLQTIRLQEEQTKNTMRRKIISIYRQMNFNIWSEAKQDMVADMEKIEASVMEHWKKKLNDYDIKELGKIISVLEEKWLEWFYQKQSKTA